MLQPVEALPLAHGFLSLCDCYCNNLADFSQRVFSPLPQTYLLSQLHYGRMFKTSKSCTFSHNSSICLALCILRSQQCCHVPPFTRKNTALELTCSFEKQSPGPLYASPVDNSTIVSSGSVIEYIFPPHSPFLLISALVGIVRVSLSALRVPPFASQGRPGAISMLVPDAGVEPALKL